MLVLCCDCCEKKIPYKIEMDFFGQEAKVYETGKVDSSIDFINSYWNNNLVFCKECAGYISNAISKSHVEFFADIGINK